MGKLNPLFQEYFERSTYTEGANGNSYNGQLPPVQQAHPTIPQGAVHTMSMPTGAGPGAILPPSGPQFSIRAPAGLAPPALRDISNFSNAQL